MPAPPPPSTTTITLTTDPDGDGTYTGNEYVTFVSGKSLFALNSATGTLDKDLYTTSETIFMVATDKTGGGKNYNVYIGYNNMPSIDPAVGIEGIAYVTNSYYQNQIDVVYIDAARLAGISGVDTFFVKDGSNILTNSTGRYYSFPAIVDGKETTIKIDPAIRLNWDGSGAEALEDAEKGMYALNNVVINSDGVITSCTMVNDTYFDATTGAATGTIAANGVVIGSGVRNATAEFYAYNESTNVYLVDDEYKTITVGSISDITTDENDLIYAAFDSNNKVLTDVVVVDRPDTVTLTYDVSSSGNVLFWDGSNWVTSLTGVSEGTVVQVIAADSAERPVSNTVALSRYTTAWAGSRGAERYCFEMPAQDVNSTAFSTQEIGYGLTDIELSSEADDTITVEVTNNTAMQALVDEDGFAVTYSVDLLKRVDGVWSRCVSTCVGNESGITVTYTGDNTAATYMVRVTVMAGTNNVVIGTYESDAFDLTVSHT